MKVCVIGAGVGGLCAARHSLEAGLEVVVFEKSDEIGGIWVYSEETDKDIYDLDVHTSRYQSLTTNLPKEIMGFPDFPITIGDKSFLTADQIQRFNHTYADYFDLKRHIKFLHCVVLVEPYADTQWRISTKDLVNNIVFTTTFDFVLVCNGIHQTPHIPIYPGQDRFHGKQLHSHKYRRKDIFHGERVLIVGSGASAVDLISDARNLASYVAQSYRSNNTVDLFSSYNVVKRYPEIEQFTSEEVVFVDGRKEVFTIVVYCTGYRYNLPFLSASCGVTTKGNQIVSPLWQHCINIHRPTMAIIGLCQFVMSSQIMDIQIRFSLKFFTGVKSLPSHEEMLLSEANEISKRLRKGIKKTHFMGVPYMDQYQKELARLAEIKPLSPVSFRLFRHIVKIGESDLLNLRNNNFKIVNKNKGPYV
ncbi:Flavin-containing monooxygenase [Sergentomyia squamirostris]